MKILVTGGTGFIGTNLTKKLLEMGYELHVVVRREPVDPDNNILYYIDNGSIEEMESYFASQKFDGVIHLASIFLASHKAEQIDELINSNVLFGTRVLECAAKYGVKWFINTGTFWQNYQNESYSPVNLYAATKQAFQDIAKYYVETFSIKFITLKLNDTYGPEDTRRKIFNLWADISKSGSSLQMSPGEQFMDIVYIDDVISAYARLIELLSEESSLIESGSEYAVLSGERVTLKELASIFENTVGQKLNIEWGKREYREREVMTPWENGKPLPGWTAKVPFEEGIKLSLKL